MKKYMQVKFTQILIFIILIPCQRIFAEDSIVKDQNALFDQIILSDKDKVVFKEYTKQKVEEFQQYIVTVGNKSEPMELRDMAEREAIKLFYKGSQIEISHLKDDGKTEIIARPVEKYLARLKSLPYTKVEIKYYDIAYITDFIRGPDGRYYSTATIVQQFTGFMGDRVQYSDITKKEIEIVIDLVEDTFFKEKRWKIFLGNIKAIETTTNIPTNN
jgi:hypothetical protein